MDKKIKTIVKNIAISILLIVVSAIAIITSIVIGTNTLQEKIYTISIYDDGKLTEVRTTTLSAEKAMEAANVKLGEHDRLNVDFDNPDDANIYVERAKKVSLTIGEEEKVVYTLKESVADVLAENNIQVATYDYVNTIAENPLNNVENNIVYKKAIPVNISIDNEISVVYTTKNTIKEILEEKGLEVNDDAFVNQKPSDTIDLSNAQILIVTARGVTLKYDGKSNVVTTQAKTVGEVLSQNNVKLSGLDKLANGITVNTKVKENMVISVIRVVEKKVTEEIVLQYQTVKQNTNELLKNFTKVVSKGSNGKKVNTYTIVTENGKQVSRTLTSSVVTKQPVDAVTKVGTKTYTTFSGSFKLNRAYSKIIDVTAVSYNLEGMKNRLPSDPKYGLTANGMKVRAGIIAVDKRVIPVGTKVYVEMPNGNDYGYAIAADVGVSGKTIDIYLNSKAECINFGRRKAKVYILQDQSVDIFKLRGG